MPRNKKHHTRQRDRKFASLKKLNWKPSTLLYPAPAVMVTCVAADGRPNIITIAWAGTTCSDPPMLSIAVRPDRYSHALIRESGEFVVNIPSAALVWATDYCGVTSGRDVDKFAKTRLTPVPALIVKPPIIAECPINIECKVAQMFDLGSHTMFLAEVVAIQASEDLMTKDGRLALERAGLFSYTHGHYYALGKRLGHFGYSVRKREPGQK
jgi:flavin reductase (DIM6/NTAB) family NADH-FMN oxidoreductase RutF